MRQAIRGPNRQEILDKIKDSEFDYTTEEMDESIITHNVNLANEEQQEEVSSYQWGKFKTWPVLIKIGTPLYIIWEFLYVIIFFIFILYKIPQTLATFDMNHVHSLIQGDDYVNT